jgi:ribosome-associated protein
MPCTPTIPQSPMSPASSIPLAPGLAVNEASLEWTYSRASGPGGQNVNKVSSRATLRLLLSDLPIPSDAVTRLTNLAGHLVVGTTPETRCLLISADSSRSQPANRAECLEKLRALLLQALPRPKVRRKTKISKGAHRRRLEGKRLRSDIKRGRRDTGE